MMNVQNVNELRELLTVENLDNMKYIEFTIMSDDMNYFSIFKSRNIVCCDVIDNDDMIVNNYYHRTVEDMINQIVECMREYE